MAKKEDISYEKVIGEAFGKMLDELEELEKENRRLREYPLRRGIDPDQLYNYLN